MKVKSIVKDYLTGKEYVAIKNKEDLPIKGYANVYLYNARTGKLEVEAHTPNIIYPEIYAWLKSYQWDKFCTGAYNKTNSYGGYWEMDNIYLVTSNAPENQRVTHQNYSTDANGNPGQQIGWANKSTYTGSDTQRGTPNTAESYANNTRIHWVFDWPTHAANGTFQTIIWGNRLLPYGKVMLQTATGISVSILTSFGMTYAESYVYALAYDGKLYKLSTSGQVQGSYVSTGISTSSNGGFGLAYDGSYLYALTYNGQLYKLSTSGEVQGSAVSTGIEASGYSGFGLAYVYPYLYAITYDGKLYKMTTSGQVQGSYVSTGIANLTQYSTLALSTDGSYLYATDTNGNLYKLNTSGSVLSSAISIGVSADSDGGFGIACDGDNFYTLIHNGTFSKITIVDHYFARTLLASPVTKTSTQTMKIQYDFVCG